ncbi:ABC transporter permease [Actinoplanes sp. NBRC 14428]|uniref:Putative ABC transport system permease protein n=1 Tax=Pseudosporangium ferrugineum TaxID=439699 RepID=A0A2T0RLK1_9ACTN|nr:ABC transporter permease [Pseudosporangium ferrugineum]PRY22002.1 putative ABC transport system permease protein [Pseudosporangium ferrugineum]BCJ50729.1 ABC transporter permease [Actinoplanes sp. NBRC 14428]
MSRFEVTRPVRLAPADLLGLGLVGLRTRKLRAALSALGISIGIATMIVVTGIPASSQASLMRELSALGANVLQAMPLPDQEPPALLPEESVAMVQRIGPVTVASAVANTHTVVRRSDRTDPNDGLGLTVLAARLDLPAAINARIRYGKWLSPVTGKFPTVVLGSVAAARLGFSGLPPGGPPPQVMIRDTWFTVVGILATTPLSPDIDRSVLVGWEAARGSLRFDGHPTVIYLQVEESQLEAVRAVLPATIFPERPGQVTVTRPSDALAAKRASENNFSSLLLALAAVALLVGGIGVANTMVISVLERRSEIGLRRALGANRGQIRGQFLTEAVALATLGGVAGTALGLLTTVGYATYHGWPIVVPLQAVLAGIGGAIVVGVVAGVYPSVRASRLTPTQALATV